MRGSYLLSIQAALGIAVGAFSSVSIGQEARCVELGAACLSAEALNGGLAWNGDYFNPTDSTSKQATFGSGAGFARGRSVAMSTDSTALSRLPAGHRVQTFLASAPLQGGTIWIGDDDLPSRARYAVRWYEYRSPDFSYFGSKLFAANNTGGAGAGQFAAGDRVQLYGLNGHTYSGGTMGDCCLTGPPVGVSGYQSSLSLQGKWWRFEMVLENPAGPGIRYRLYAKNVTDNRAEVAVIDTGVRCPSCTPNPAGLGESDLRPPSGLVNDLLINGYRESEGGEPLSGWRGWSHVLYAGWNSNAGQRIGAAQEIEGSTGGEDPAPGPNPPTNLSVE